MSTQLRIFKADAALKWLKAGWLIFKTQPLTFIFAVITNSRSISYTIFNRRFLSSRAYQAARRKNYVS